ncbi:hypothetical protein GCM10027517_03200 [Phycicoccus ginsengisoli]
MTAEAIEPVACQVCGVESDGPMIRRRTTTSYGRPTPQRDYLVTTCPACLTLDPDRPGLAVRAALRVLGKPEDDPLAAEAFELAGVDVTAVLFDFNDPVRGRRREPQRKPFGHVDRAGRKALRWGHTRLVALRLEREREAAAGPDVPTPPPDGAPPACLACGLGLSLRWYGPLTTNALTRGPGMVTGYLCDACGPVYAEVGAAGPNFLERAVTQAKGLDHVPPRLRAWAATGLPPREAGWDWVDTSPPVQELDPWTAAMELIADLTERVAALEGRDV